MPATSSELTVTADCSAPEGSRPRLLARSVPAGPRGAPAFWPSMNGPRTPTKVCLFQCRLERAPLRESYFSTRETVPKMVLLCVVAHHGPKKMEEDACRAQGRAGPWGRLVWQDSSARAWKLGCSAHPHLSLFSRELGQTPPSCALGIEVGRGGFLLEQCQGCRDTAEAAALGSPEWS